MSPQGEEAAPRALGKESCLETQWVEVSDELRFCWHRPPLDEVERQYGDPGTVRIFLNGCFDLMHVGHFNALRQAKSLFARKGYERVVLIAGIHSDAAIARQKGAPLMSDEERLAVLRATKWVDELATDLPYVSMSARMADALRVHFICHGDDLPICKSGGGMYSNAIEEGRFQVLKRTEGISTTQILDRLLRREQEAGRGESEAEASSSSQAGAGAAASVGALEATPATVWRLTQFAAPSDPRRPPRSLDAAQRVVYVVGAFDLLHPGHVEFLEGAAGLGDYLLVGLYSDETLHKHRGFTPVLTLPERAMAVLSLRHVDDVVLGAPWLVGRELLTAFNICTVAIGRRPGSHEAGGGGGGGGGQGHDGGRFAVPRGMGILAEVGSSCPLTAAALAARCLDRGAELTERNRGLLAKEFAYIGEKGFVPEA